MKNRIRFAITLAGAVLCALPNVAMAQSSPGDSQDGQSAAIEGTWTFRILRVNTGIIFTALQSFTAGGVTLAIGSMPIPPALVGSWRSTGENSYAATINFFVFDSAGNANMIQNIETFQLKDGNIVNGIGTAFQCNPDGSHCGPPLPMFAISFCGVRLTAGSFALAPAACPF